MAATAAALLVLCIAPTARTQGERHLNIYTSGAMYSVPTVVYDGRDYVGLADVLEPLGNVEAREDGKKWKIRFVPAGGREVNAEFQQGKNKGKVRSQDFQLSANFQMENGRGYIPLHNIGALLPFFTGLSTDLRESSLRLLVGDVAVKFTQHLQREAPAKLILSFSSPVNPVIATEPGRLRLLFRREALVNSGADTVQTGDPTITATTFSDANGSAQLAINGTVPLAPAFADGNRTIIISALPPTTPPVEAAKTQVPQPILSTSPAAAAPSQPAAAPPAAPASTPTPPSGPRFVVLLDPAHGGDERGAAITETIQEKDVNLALARRIQRELQNKGINAGLLRSGDNTVSLDDRATAANSAHPSVYVAIHAANLGTGVRVFTTLMAPAPAGARKFLPWAQAQAPYLDLSADVAGSVAAELRNRQVPLTALPAPLRPMRNIAAPAIALELAPPDDDVGNINQVEYQQNVAAAIANGIAAMKPRLAGAK